nr:hypothetical protein [Tanacetum cinerariifolium]
RDTIQLETAVSTISQEYLLEFTSEYGISEDLHPELPDLEERIVDFSEGKDEMPAEDTYSQEAVTVLNIHRSPIQKQPEALLCLVGSSRRYFLRDDVYPTFLHDDVGVGICKLAMSSHIYKNILTTFLNCIYGFVQFDPCSEPHQGEDWYRPRAAHKVLLLTVTASRVIEMEDPVAATYSFGVPSTIERSPMDFSNENPSQQSTEGNRTEDQGQETVAPEVPPPENVTTTGVAPEACLVEEIAATGLPVIKECHKRGNDGSIVGGKSLASMGLGTGSTFPVPTSQETPADGTAIAGDPELKNTSFTSMVGSPEIIYHPEWGVTNGCRLDAPKSCQNLVDHIPPPGFEQEAKLLKKSIAQVARRDQRIQARENEIKNLEALLEAETGMKKAVEAKNAELSKELENLCALFLDLQVSNDRLSQQVSTLQAQVTREENLKAVFEEFKQYEDDRVEKHCAEIDALLDALSIDFDEELYPHMIIAIASRRWVIGHGLRSAVMKCGESTELRQVFADVVSAGIAKGMNEGLKYGVEHENANLGLEAIEAYDTKYVVALHTLRDLKNPMVDQLESLKDALIDVIMASLHLESDTEKDAAQWIHKLRSSSSQLKIPVYLEVRDPKDPWSFKEEILLVDAITANVSHAKKKKDAGWCVVPMGSVPRIMPGLMVFRCQCIPLLRKDSESVAARVKTHLRGKPITGIAGL